MQLTVRVYGARLLPRLGRVDILDPVVQVSLLDGSPKAPTFVSAVVVDNGFNPNWDFKCEIPIKVALEWSFPFLSLSLLTFCLFFFFKDSSNSFLVLQVLDNSSSGVLVGHWCIGVENIRPGYRVARLLDSHFTHINRGMCHVFLKLDLE